MNYKFNSIKLNFHEFLFIYFNKLRKIDKFLPDDIYNYLAEFGFFIDEETKTKFHKKYKITDDDYLSFILAVQELFKFYSSKF